MLRDGELLAIFPEGGITRDGTVQPFKGGIMKILDRATQDGLTVPVIPMALTNLWGSFFSRVEVVEGEPTAMNRPFRRGSFNRVGLNVGEPLAVPSVTPDGLRQAGHALLGPSPTSCTSGVCPPEPGWSNWHRRGLKSIPLVIA